MNLQLGGFETIADVTDSDIARYLRLMDVENSFVILSNTSSEFIQAAFLGDKYQIEYSIANGSEQYQQFGSYDVAKELFLSFLNNDTSYRKSGEWKPIGAQQSWLKRLIGGNR